MRRTSKIADALRDMADRHAGHIAPIRELLDRLPKPVSYDLPDLDDVLRRPHRPVINITIFVNKEQNDDQ